MCKIGSHYEPALNISTVERFERETVVIADSPTKRASLQKPKNKSEPIVVLESPKKENKMAQKASISLQCQPICLSNRFKILADHNERSEC